MTHRYKRNARTLILKAMRKLMPLLDGRRERTAYFRLQRILRYLDESYD